MKDSITWEVVAIALITAMPAIIAALKASAAVKAVEENTAKTEQIHVAINSRMDELLAVTKDAERALGVIEGTAAAKSEKDQADLLALTKAADHAEGVIEGSAAQSDKP